MGGGLLQLVAFGAQDVYLTGSPQITYFKVVFKRHTNFAIESIAQTFSGSVRYGSKVTAVISRNGDLLGELWLESVMKKNGTTFYPAEALINRVSVELGGQELDKLTSTWYRIYDNLYRNTTERAAYQAMTDFVGDGTTVENNGTTKRFFTPILFWFCRSPGNYIPLIALQYHELRVTIDFASAIDGIDTSTDLQATLWADYVFLDQTERKKFASQPHEYLIEQVQFTGDENVSVSDASAKSQQIRLSFNHPTKLLAWVVADPSKHGKFTGGSAGSTAEAFAPLQSAKLMLNGHDRAETRVGAYYNKVVPYQAAKANPDAGIYYMSFALSPTQHAPSGSLNLSRIDSAVLALTFKQATTGATLVSNITTPETHTIADTANLSALRVFAVNYNVLRVNRHSAKQWAACMVQNITMWGKQCKCSDAQNSVYNPLVIAA